MKHILKTSLLGLGLSALPVAVLASAPAQAYLSNDSVRMYPGDCSCGFGLTWTLHFSSFFTEDPGLADGEIAPAAQPATHSHYAFLVLVDPSTVASTTFARLDLPSGDVNGNGTQDFFEANVPVTTATTGYYENIWGNGQLTLEWTRSAGSIVGSCVLTMIDPILGRLGPYNHSFELAAFSGELTYTPGSNYVTGNIQLQKTGQPAEVLAGPISLIKVDTNRFNQLSLVSGTWTNQAIQFSFNGGELARDPANPSVYRGLLQNPTGSYRSWTLAILDSNDADGNGIPDLSDDLITVSPPRRPALALALTGGQLSLRISGDLNRTHLVQEAVAPDATNWTTVHSLTLTNDPHVVTLPLPAQSPAFWRVLAQ